MNYQHKISNDCVFPASWTADTLMQKHRSLPHNPDIAISSAPVLLKAGATA